MRQLVTVEYRCATHESPVKTGCDGCAAVVAFEEWAEKLRVSRTKLVAQIKEKLAAKVIVVAEMR